MIPLLKLLYITLLIGIHKPDIKTAKADLSLSMISYHMVHPLHSWEGISKKFDAVIQYESGTGKLLSVTVTASVASFDSKNKSRDQRALVFTNATQFPDIIFKSTVIHPTEHGADITGNLSFHGISRPVNLKVDQVLDPGHIICTGTFMLLLEDFKVERPSLLMTKTNNDFTIRFYMNFPVG